ncbi:hypothetical protein [Nitrospirillum amazonense]|uniref:Uncharacterized protein n=1 Tax=Nitrospirillum amazonense TaxID=28077 RepID=A0A560JC01_9PROT|nr:hypothetical protein [Nitrospirillum amazonense]MDG3439907.1 hypothetical protein [Nitrospirillum amazonense]TWB68723.1 hypothetical protein FBZ87_11031 [Nitrospirillum amazonense]
MSQIVADIEQNLVAFGLSASEASEAFLRALKERDIQDEEMLPAANLPIPSVWY